jgi:hypothetical protein
MAGRPDPVAMLKAAIERQAAEIERLKDEVGKDFKRTMFDDVAHEYTSRGIPIRYAAAFLKGRESWTWAEVAADVAEIEAVRREAKDAKTRDERTEERGRGHAAPAGGADFIPTR